jgi:Ca-activated chloride channel family protein
VAAALALALPGAAAAQIGGAATPVVGGGSFNAAPLIEPGRYRDTLLPGERLHYGIELQAGQSLRVAGELDVRQGEIDFDTAVGFSIGIATPLRENEVTDLVDRDVTGNTSVSTNLTDRIEFVSTPVLAASGARGSSGNYRGPGTWYVSLYLSSQEEEPARVELPVDFEVEVMGEPQPDAEPEPTPAEPTPSPEREQEGSDGGGPSAGALLGTGVGGLLAGLAGGALLGRRRSTHRP